MAERRQVRNFGTSLAFSSSADRVTTSYTPSLTAFSVGFWVKIRQRVINARFVDWQESGPTHGFTFVNDVTKVNQIKFLAANLTVFTKTLPLQEWVHIVGTYSWNGSASTVKIYVNGELNATSTSGAQMITADGQTLSVGNRSANDGNPANAVMNQVLMYDRELTAAEVASLHYDGLIPVNPDVHFKFDEGSGTVAVDASNNGNTGTISGPTFFSDVQISDRRQVNPNLIKNGSFDSTPRIVSATTSTTKWIDGLSAGSNTNSIFGWAWVSNTTTRSAGYDITTKRSGKASMKLTVTTVGAGTYAFIDTTFNSNSGIVPQLIPIKPSTSYVLTFYVKTSGVTGNGAAIRIYTKDLDGTTVQLLTTSKSTATEWTKVSYSFTTGATEQYVRIIAGFFGNTDMNDGAIVWFDDIELRPATPVARPTAGERLKVRDFVSALKPSGNVISGNDVIDVSESGATACFWGMFVTGAGNNIVEFRDASSNDSFRINLENNTNKLFVWTVNSSGSGALGCKTDYRVPPNVWFHIAFTYNSSTQLTEIYINGVKKKEGTGNVCRATDFVRIYTSSNGGEFLDDLIVHNRVLTLAEIKDIYYRDIVSDDGLILRWKLNEATGSTATDSSGNGNNGTISSSSLWYGNVPIIPRSSV